MLFHGVGASAEHMEPLGRLIDAAPPGNGPACCGIIFTTAITTSELTRYQTAEKIAKTHIATFDTLDFDVFTNQKWDRLKESHSADVAVHWHATYGASCAILTGPPDRVSASRSRSASSNLPA
jgi:hypothetical protein